MQLLTIIRKTELNVYVSRYVNEILLSAGDKEDNITMHFHHKLISADLDNPRLTFQLPDGATVEEPPDFVSGCDGAFSTIRRVMMKRWR